MTEVSERKHGSIGEPGGYAEFVRFYARQARLLDQGDTEGWALTFARDGVFRSPGRPAPVTGRKHIQDAVRPMADDLATGRIVRRHWAGMLEVELQPDGSAHALSYAQVVETPRGGESVLRRIGTCTDILIREDGRWVVQDRTVSRDDQR
jgi:hypothetical protein